MEKRLRWRRFIRVVFGAAVAAGLAMGVWHMRNFNNHVRMEPRFPLKRLDVRMDRGAFQQYDRAMRNFANAFGFSAEIRQTSPEPTDILYYFKREDIDLVSTNDTEKGAPSLTFSVDV